MPGPRPTPTSLKLIRGNPGRRPLRAEPKPTAPTELPEPPEFLTSYAKDEWYRVGEELLRFGLLTVVDIQPLAAYCEAYAKWRTATEKLAAMAERDPVMAGLIVKTRNGGVMQNPLSLTARQAANDMVRYASEFGFTPAARSRVSAIEANPAPGKFDGLLA